MDVSALQLRNWLFAGLLLYHMGVQRARNGDLEHACQRPPSSLLPHKGRELASRKIRIAQTALACCSPGPNDATQARREILDAMMFGMPERLLQSTTQRLRRFATSTAQSSPAVMCRAMEAHLSKFPHQAEWVVPLVRCSRRHHVWWEGCRSSCAQVA